MNYWYHCKRGCPDYEIIKSYKDIDRDEVCPKCEVVGERFFNPGRPQIMNAGDGWNDKSFNPAFGKVIGSKANLRRELADAKARGNELIEVGNESPAKLHAAAEQKIADKAKANWAKASAECGITN